MIHLTPFQSTCGSRYTDDVTVDARRVSPTYATELALWFDEVGWRMASGCRATMNSATGKVTRSCVGGFIPH